MHLSSPHLLYIMWLYKKIEATDRYSSSFRLNWTLPLRNATDPLHCVKKKVHSLHSIFFFMFNVRTCSGGRGHCRVTSSDRKVSMAPSIHTAKVETVSSLLSTLQAHSRFTHAILGSCEGGPVGRSPTVSSWGVHCWQHHRVGPRGSPRAFTGQQRLF